MSKLRISIVQYLNTAPLVWGFTHGPLQGKYDLSFTVPSRCADDLKRGKADFAIIPAIETQRIEGLAILPGLAIASKQEVRSLLMLSKCPIEQAQTIALDQSSRSTQALTRILCAEKWKIEPRFSQRVPQLDQMLADSDAALLIGDPALRLSLASGAGHDPGAQGQSLCPARNLGVRGVERLHVYDMVREWRSLTGFPAVLAVWAARKEVCTREIVADFLGSADCGISRIDEISFRAAKELELPAAALESYLRRNIDYSLDPENRRGLEKYFELSEKHGLIPRARPLDWAETGIAESETLARS